MKCIEKKKWLAYLKGELDECQRKELGEHLDQCPRCRELAGGLKMAFAELDNLEGLEPRPHFSAIIRQEVLNRQRVKWWQRVALPAVATAAAVLSIALGIFLGQSLYSMLHSDESTRNSTQTANLYYEGASVEFYDNGGI